MDGFKQYVEVHDEYIDKLVKRLEASPEQLPLNNMFNGKLRVAVPFMSNDLKQLEIDLWKNGYVADFAKGVAKKKIKTQRGEKEVTENIGKVLGKLGIKYWIDYWNKNAGGYSIIFTRHPIDILRMSDFKNIQSCHSQGGQYFYCAIQEAKDGGAIAYLVKTEDLKQISLDDKEIFSDPDRDVHGIKPISRIRLRRFVNDEVELGLPERRQYGADIPGFREAVKDWVSKALEPTLKGERPSMDDFKRAGGQYQDTISSAIFNDFFGDKQDSGDIGRKKYKDEDEDDENAKARNEMEEYLHQGHSEHDVTFWYTEADEPDHETGRIYFDWGCDVRFLYPKRDFLKDPTNHSVESDINNGIRKAYHFNFGRLHTMDIETNWGLVFGVEDENCGYGGSPQDFRNFIRECRGDYDESYNFYEVQIRKWLIDNGFLKSDSRDRLVKIMKSERFDNFYIGDDPYGDEEDIKIQSYSVPLMTEEQFKIRNQTWHGMAFGNSVAIEVQTMVLRNLRAWWDRIMKHQGQQPSLPGIPQQPFKDWMKKMEVPTIELSWSRLDRKPGEPGRNLEMQAIFPFSLRENPGKVASFLRGVRFFDKNWDRFIWEVKKDLSNL